MAKVLLIVGGVVFAATLPALNGTGVPAEAAPVAAPASAGEVRSAAMTIMMTAIRPGIM